MLVHHMLIATVRKIQLRSRLWWCNCDGSDRNIPMSKITNPVTLSYIACLIM
jgi:hypothetical protein